MPWISSPKLRLVRLRWQAAHPTCNPPDRLAFASELSGSRIGVKAKRCSMPWDHNRPYYHSHFFVLSPPATTAAMNPGDRDVATISTWIPLPQAYCAQIIPCFFSGPGHVLQWSSSPVSPTHGSPPLAWGVTSTVDVNLCVFFVLQGSHIHLAEDALSAAQVAIDRLRVATPPPQVCEANGEGAGI